MATGSNVLVAVIDSAIDIKHPDLAGAVVEKFDAAGSPDKPHTHGTGMAGAIAAHGRLIGVAPGARCSPSTPSGTGGRQSPQATTRNIIAGLEWAIAKGARHQHELRRPVRSDAAARAEDAHDKGAVLIAAAGNQGRIAAALSGRRSARDRRDGDRRERRSSTAPTAARMWRSRRRASTSGGGARRDLSIHDRNLGCDRPCERRCGAADRASSRGRRQDGPRGADRERDEARRRARDDQFGWGLVDPASALDELDARVADNKVASPRQATRAQAVRPRAGRGLVS